MAANDIAALYDASIFQGNQLILRNVNVTIGTGEFTYLIGKTGSGKSSLLKTLYAGLPLRQGKGYVAGFNLQNLTRKTIPLLRRKLGIVFQDFNLLSDRSVRDNLLFVLKATGWKDKNNMQTRMDKVLDEVGLKDSQLKMPHELSGGEKQRIVIARALLNHPSLIIADEPTGNLDPDTSDDIVVLLRQLCKERNVAVLFATHDYRILERFPGRILRCHDGIVKDEENFVI